MVNTSCSKSNILMQPISHRCLHPLITMNNSDLFTTREPSVQILYSGTLQDIYHSKTFKNIVVGQPEFPNFLDVISGAAAARERVLLNDPAMYESLAMSAIPLVYAKCFPVNVQLGYDILVGYMNRAADIHIPFIKINLNPSNNFKLKSFWSMIVSKSVAERRLALSVFRNNPIPDKPEIRETAAIVNLQLTKLVSEAPNSEAPEERLDLDTVVEILTELLHHSSVHTRTATLDWILQNIAK